MISGIAIVISCANIIRGANGLPVLFIVLLILFEDFIKRKLTWKSILISIAVLACTANLLSTTIPCCVAYKWGVPGKEGYNSSPWHAILTGMGYLENEYGLAWNDNNTRELIGVLYPDVIYNSDEYYECCKKVALQIFTEDPKFVIKGLFAKLWRCFGLQMKYISGKSAMNLYSYRWIFIGMALEVFVLVRIKKIKDYARKYLSLIVICAGLTFLSIYSGVLVYPAEYYILGALGGIGVAAVSFFLTMGAVIIQYVKDKLVNQKIETEK